MQKLPDLEEQEWLIQALAGLIAVRGAGPFVSMPLVEPTSKFFPDPWSFSHQGLDRVTRRLLQYAGLGSLEISLEVFNNDDWHSRSEEADESEDRAAALFFGIKNNVCRFGFNIDSPADEEYMAGILAHEVSHAYRQYYGIRRADTVDEEELLTDVTSVYLGFGILTTNNSYRYRTHGWNQGYLAYRSTSNHWAGYLTPQAFAYLLALQVHARGGREERKLIQQLETTHSDLLKAALKSIKPWKNLLPGRLGISGPAPSFHSSVDPSSLQQPLPEMPDYDEEYIPNPHNEGDIVFRLRRANPIAGIGAGFFIGIFATAPITYFVSSAPLEKIFPVGILLGLILGWYLERRWRHEICSDPECNEDLPDGLEKCPSCGGRIVGSISDPWDRHAAREAYEEAHGLITPDASEIVANTDRQWS